MQVDSLWLADDNARERPMEKKPYTARLKHGFTHCPLPGPWEPATF